MVGHIRGIGELNVSTTATVALSHTRMLVRSVTDCHDAKRNNTGWQMTQSHTMQAEGFTNATKELTKEFADHDHSAVKHLAVLYVKVNIAHELLVP